MLSVLVERVVDGKLNFEQLEKLLWQSTLEVFRHLMAEVLERVDKELTVRRNAAREHLPYSERKRGVALG